ncbi:MAG: HAMP domain-containing protein [Planctomycetota bacterium]|nr:MAG: HAMP domain-containing protein [Planctomycetota bacterium]
MTRLFLRFYIGVVVILAIAWCVNGFLYTQPKLAENLRVVERALAGGVHLAMDRLNDAAATGGEAAMHRELKQIQEVFHYPVRVRTMDAAQFSSSTTERLENGEVVFFFQAGGRIAGLLADRRHVVEFGPLPSLVGPSSWQLMTAYGAVLMVAAVAIALLLRPVVRQMRAIERTALAIAEGDFSARVAARTKAQGLAIAHAFNTMAERTESLLNSQRELLQAVSHELRTPLARIRFAVDLLESDDDSTSQHEHLASIERATGELDDLVGELLSYARMEVIEPEKTREEFDLVDVSRDVVASRQQIFPAVRFEVRAERDSVLVQADRRSVERAIGNLVSNAGRFARQRVVMSIDEKGGTAIIRIDDDGPGIDPKDRQRIFEPFVRLPGAPGRGAGLGLVLVSRIVRSHQGSIQVATSPLGGARFEIQFPLRGSVLTQ